MKISVVTPCYNSRPTLEETLASVRSQSHPDIEHIVMDGGSTDGTLEILALHPGLVTASEKDEGQYDAMNRGISKATGEIIAVLNSDDCYLPGALSAVAAAFESHPEWDGLFTDYRMVDANGRTIYTRREATWDYDVLRFGLGYVLHPTLFLRAKTYRRIGAFDHRSYKTCCDYDLLLRLGKAGCRIGHLPFIAVAYRVHPRGQTADLRIQANNRRESLILQQLHGRPPGWRGAALNFLARAKRQLQKLILRGHVDCIPGHWLLRRHSLKKGLFSTNSGADRL